jgi:Ca2+-binding RTX toxin-like protein
VLFTHRGSLDLSARLLKLGKMSRDKLPKQLRRLSPTSRDSGATRVAPIRQRLYKGGTDVRRTILLVAMMVLTVLVASGVALAVTKIGTDGPDTLRGTNGADNLLGNGANDVLFALGGKDNLVGAEGKDWVLGGDERRPFGGDKTLIGGPGNDGVNGGVGSDIVLGGAGNDYLIGDNGSDRLVMGGEGKDIVSGSLGSDNVVGGSGTDLVADGPFDDTSKDTLSGGAGDDVFQLDNLPKTKDIVSCGEGFDWVLADRKDVVAPDCERVRVVHGSEAEIVEQEQAFLFESVPPEISTFFDFANPFENFFEEQLAPDPVG